MVKIKINSRVLVVGCFYSKYNGEKGTVVRVVDNSYNVLMDNIIGGKQWFDSTEIVQINTSSIHFPGKGVI
jgi:ribosomal protein L21E